MAPKATAAVLTFMADSAPDLAVELAEAEAEAEAVPFLAAAEAVGEVVATGAEPEAEATATPGLVPLTAAEGEPTTAKVIVKKKISHLTLSIEKHDGNSNNTYRRGQRYPYLRT